MFSEGSLLSTITRTLPHLLMLSGLFGISFFNSILFSIHPQLSIVMHFDLIFQEPRSSILFSFIYLFFFSFHVELSGSGVI